MEIRLLLSANVNKEYYIDAVLGSGAIAVCEYCPEVSTDYDGLILCGGNDINPSYYGEEIDGSVNIDCERDVAEFALAKAFIQAKKPILGICRGHQLLNVVFGGTLYQHIDNADYHTNKTEDYLSHNVTASADSLCGKLYGEKFCVNSSHHQAVKKLGNDLIVNMYSDDIIEGYEHKQLPVFGIQWHPERMCFSQKRDDTVDGCAVFEFFIDLCKKHKLRGE